jgi:hypothetical protein
MNLFRETAGADRVQNEVEQLRSGGVIPKSRMSLRMKVHSRVEDQSKICVAL